MADPQDPQYYIEPSWANVLNNLVPKRLPLIAQTRATRTPIYAPPTTDSAQPMAGINISKWQNAYYMPGMSTTSPGFIALNTANIPQSPDNWDAYIKANQTIAHEQWHANQAANPARARQLWEQIVSNPDVATVGKAITYGGLDAAYPSSHKGVEVPAFLASDSLRSTGYGVSLAHQLLKDRRAKAGLSPVIPMQEYKDAFTADVPALIKRAQQALIDHLTPQELKMVRRP